MALYAYEFDPIPKDVEIFLSDEPLNLLKSQIQNQFNSDNSNKYDYVSAFIENYNYSVLQIEDEYDSQELERLSTDFILYMVNLFRTFLDIEINNTDTMSMSMILDIIHMTYRYFILNKKKNVYNVCRNYIDNYYDNIISIYNKKSGMTASLIVNEIGCSEEDAVVITNLNEIIKDIISMDALTVDDFLKYSVYNKPILESDLMIEYFEDFTLVGNFVKSYMNLVNDDLIKEVESKIRVKLMKKLANK